MGGYAAASDFQSLTLESLLLSCCLLLGLFLSHLLRLLFVANENKDCSALTNEIIVTMHTFQDVSWSRGAEEGQALGESWAKWARVWCLGSMALTTEPSRRGGHSSRGRDCLASKVPSVFDSPVYPWMNLAGG